MAVGGVFVGGLLIVSKNFIRREPIFLFWVFSFPDAPEVFAEFLVQIVYGNVSR